MRRAFTLLEILVATMLLAMLVTILTMIFNQSSVAWTIGIASLTGLDDARKSDAVYAADADNAILRDGSGGNALFVTSVWKEDGDGVRRDGRTLESGGTSITATEMSDNGSAGQTRSIGSGNSNGQSSYIVGVTSWGPDGQQGTWDDITTMPEEVVK